MARKSRLKEGVRIGPWSLIEPLGSGGNAEVWRANDCDGQIVALKILYTTTLDSEPYKRFKAEIDFLRSLGQQPGVLPIIDAALPQQPGRKNPAWLAMPVATPIAAALGNSPDISTVVGAIERIAETLALLAEKEVSHRDIKPGNLYWFDGGWAIGDFGLVKHPDKEALTLDGKSLGPRHFMPDEMISDPKLADSYRADVFSLAKTLWVLATGKKDPPQGEQRTDVPEVNLSYSIDHPRILLLDRLIESATRHDPKVRPTMREFAMELGAWLAPQIEAASPADLSDLFKRIAATAELGNRAENRRQEQIALAQAALSAIKEKLHPITQAFEKTGLGVWTLDTEIEGYVAVGSSYWQKHYKEDIRTCTLFRRYYGPGITLPSKTPPDQRPSQMIGEAGVILFEDGMLELHGQYFFFLRERSSVFSPPVNSIQFYLARIGSADQDRCVDLVMNHLVENLVPAFEYLAKLLKV